MLFPGVVRDRGAVGREPRSTASSSLKGRLEGRGFRSGLLRLHMASRIAGDGEDCVQMSDWNVIPESEVLASLDTSHWHNESQPHPQQIGLYGIKVGVRMP